MTQIYIVDLADSILNDELSSATEISIPVIATWLRNNIGKLNNLIYTSYTIDSTTFEYSPDLYDEEAAILRQLYLIHYYAKKARENLGAASAQPVLDVSSDGSTIRMVNKTTVAKDYISLKRDEESKLSDLLNNYKLSKLSPSQVAGNDNIAASNYINNEAFGRVESP